MKPASVTCGTKQIQQAVRQLQQSLCSGVVLMDRFRLRVGINQE